MGRGIGFEDGAFASPRARGAAAEAANPCPIAFARRHSGAVAAIREAVLADGKKTGQKIVRASPVPKEPPAEPGEWGRA